MSTVYAASFSIEAALRKAAGLYESGKLTEAEQLCREVIAAEPANPDANHNLGIIRLQSMQVEGALPYLKKAFELNPAHPQYWLNYIEALLQKRQVSESKKILERAAKKVADRAALQSCAERIEAISDDADNGRAEWMPDLMGEPYTRTLERLQDALAPRTYLEIGVETGATLALAKCSSIGIDPSFRFQEIAVVRRIVNKPALLLYQMPSDDFFASHNPAELLGGPIEFAFLDGMHRCEYLLRDFSNTERYCRPNSVIALHDCVPVELPMTERTPNRRAIDPRRLGMWTGDVWHTARLLKRKRPDLRILTLNAAPTGLVLITNLDPLNRLLAENHDAFVREMKSWSLDAMSLKQYYEEMSIEAESNYRLPEQILAWAKTRTSANEKRWTANPKGLGFESNEKSLSNADLKPPQADTLLQIAIAHQNNGRNSQADRLYREILSDDPGHAQANHNLGMLELAAGRFAVALEHFRLALLADARQGQYWLSCAEGLLLSGQVQAARAVFAQAVRQGLTGDAADHFSQRLERSETSDIRTLKGDQAGQRPVDISIREVGGSSNIQPVIDLIDQGHLDDAEKLARTLIDNFPENGLNWHALGITLGRQERLAEAEACYRRAVELCPAIPESHLNLGAALQRQGKLVEAEACYRRALAICPQMAFAHNNLATALQRQGRVAEAEMSGRRAIEIDPSLAAAYGNLGVTLQLQGRLVEAEANGRRAVQIDPNCAESHHNLGFILQDIGQHASAVEECRRALAISPQFAVAKSNLLFSLSHDASITPEQLYAEHLDYGKRFEKPLRACNYANSRDPDRPLNIGFLSGDLRDHALCYFLAPLLESLSRHTMTSAMPAGKLVLHAYSNHFVEDAMTERLRGYFAQWNRVVELSDEALADKIRDDSIDILIDLSGHTAFNRLPVLARKPAPLQCGWIGYLGTSGLGTMDYYFADRNFLPPGHFDRFFTEKLLYLPAVAAFEPNPLSPVVGPLPAIDNRYITFGSFSRCSKLSHEVISLWAKLLHAIPNARMFLGGMPLDGKPPKLEAWFEAEGIEPDRLQFHPRGTVQEYLALHHQVDICLDPFPYTGATTTCHAMWMGVPTLTLAGHTVAGRLGAALLTHAGLIEFVAASEQDFVTKGKAWASNLELLAKLRGELRQQFAQSTIGQPQPVALSFANALRGIWKDWCTDPSARTAKRLPSKSRRKHSRAGRIPASIEYRELGILLTQRHWEKAEMMAMSLTIRFPNQGIGWKALGVALDQQDRDKESLEALKQAAFLLPDDAEAHRNLCGALLKANRATEAEIACRASLATQPNIPQSWLSLGAVLIQLNRFAEAENACRRAIELGPNLAEAHGNLGAALLCQERFAEAESSYLRSIELNPCDPEMLRSLGLALHRQGKLTDAQVAIRRALAIEPRLAKAHSDLGASLLVQGRYSEAERAARTALSLDPNLNEARSNLGNVLVKLGRLAEGEPLARLATEIDPGFADAWTNLGAALEAQGKFSEALASFRQALALNPDLADAHSGLLFCLSHEVSVLPEELFAEHLRFGDRFETPLRIQWPRHTNHRAPERRLRVGFVSGDLRRHSVSFFVGPVIQHLAGNRGYSLHAYSTNGVEDETTKQLRPCFESWNNVIGLPDGLLAQKITADRIDILIDLSGHTLGNRLKTFARKPAPVQCSWIGYLGTTGLRAIDYYLADRHFLPPGTFDRLFTEKIAYLPIVASFQPDGEAPSINSLPATINGYLTFGSFSRLGKLNRAVVALWARLLRGLPGSKMLIGAMPNGITTQYLTDWFAGEGVGADRLIFEAQCGLGDYLKLHHRVDLCLDPFPFTGGTTTSHALWMGVPTLTMAGKTPPGRLGAAMLMHLGLEEFVADSPDDFVAKGLRWATDLEALSQIRITMRQRWRDSPVAQPAAIADALGDALRGMWRQWCLSPPTEEYSS